MEERLRSNDNTLTNIDLSDTGMGEKGGTEVAKALLTNTTLTMLDLPYTGISGIGEKGGTEVPKALLTNTTLTQLGLDGNKLGEKGGNERWDKR